MAQFGKHLFGTSFFGKTSTFDGEYETEIIDAGEPFNGSVRVEIKGDKPIVRYLGNDNQLAYQGSDWTRSGTTMRTTRAGSEVKFLVCGSTFNIRATGAGRAHFKHVHTEEVETHTFTDSLDIEKDYADYLLTIETTSASFTLREVAVRVANIGIEVRTAGELSDPINVIPNWDIYNEVKLTYDNTTELWVGDTPQLTGNQYVQLKLHLSTSESKASPVVDKLHFSSGDMNEHAEGGNWYCSLNMRNIARGANKTFKRVKRVRWKEREQENSHLAIRSASVTSTSSGHPARGQILDNSYWKAETAPYILKHATPGQFGQPWTRLSLAEAGNGFSQSSNRSSVMIGPIDPKKANLTNTKLTRWLNWHDQSYYPTNKQGVNTVYELYKNRDDIEQGYAPIFRITNPEGVRDRLITLSREDQTESVFLRIQLDRSSGRGSPVVDYIDLAAQMHYESPRNVGSHTENLSPLDGLLEYGENGLGKKQLRTIQSSLYDWPSLSQSLPVNTENLLANPRQVRVDYTPKYLNQVSLGLGEGMTGRDSFPADTSRSWTLYSQTDAKTPSLSTQSVPSDELFWHASYDGGTVNYPIRTERDLSTDFTPRFIDNKNYRFRIVNGWRNEFFVLPTSMTWEEVEDITGHSREAIEKENGTVKLYNGRIPMRYSLTLPNNTLNNKINFQFKTSETVLTEESLWNGKANDSIQAWIPDGGDYEYTDWVSDEIIFDGIVNPNDTFLPYVRTQSSVMNARNDSTYTVELAEETAEAIAKKFNASREDLLVRNENKTVFKKGEQVLIPGTFSLPSLAPGLIYEGENPYVIEIIPGSVRKTHDSVRLMDDVITPGSDDEPAIQYTLVDSPVMTGEMIRGSARNGGDLIPFTDVRQVIRVQDENKVLYVPYTKSQSGSEMGDYILKDNRIDWSPSHSGAKEPNAGVKYTVTVVHGIVNTMRLVYTSDYSEKMAVDRLWRSRDSIEINGIVTPEEDFVSDLPAKESFEGYHNLLTNVSYVVEDNDLWVQTSIEGIDGEEKLFATLGGENPSRNWYPTIQTGFYYIGSDEYYLYSEPRTHRFDEKDVPIIKDVSYTEDGLVLE